MRRTKIVATLGPSTDKPGVMEKMFAAGADVFRLNYSHGDQREHARRAKQIRELSKQLGQEVAIMADLQGPKIRVRRFDGGEVTLAEGQRFTLDTKLGVSDGDQTHVGVSYSGITRDVKIGNELLLDDGRIVLRVVEIMGSEVRCEVLRGGVLSGNKGVNLKGGGLSLNALAPKDLRDIKHAVGVGADYVAVSFVQRAADVVYARSLLQEHGSDAHVIAKIECVSAFDEIDDIIDQANGIMIARGDLGVEMGDASLPMMQKRLIRDARAKDRISITATQLLESMIDHQIPLRAEVFDIANATMDGSDAIMLSAETSVGMFPDLAVQTVARVCKEAEKARSLLTSDHRIRKTFGRRDESIAMAAMYTANHAGVKAIVALTETGNTCRWMSRISSGLPIYAFTPCEQASRRVKLYRGVYPVHFDPKAYDAIEVYPAILHEVRQRVELQKEDLVLVTRGDLIGKSGGTNTMKLLRAGDTMPSF